MRTNTSYSLYVWIQLHADQPKHTWGVCCCCCNTFCCGATEAEGWAWFPPCSWPPWDCDPPVMPGWDPECTFPPWTWPTCDWPLCPDCICPGDSPCGWPLKLPEFVLGSPPCGGWACIIILPLLGPLPLLKACCCCGCWEVCWGCFCICLACEGLPSPEPCDCPGGWFCCGNEGCWGGRLGCPEVDGEAGDVCKLDEARAGWDIWEGPPDCCWTDCFWVLLCGCWLKTWDVEATCREGRLVTEFWWGGASICCNWGVGGRDPGSLCFCCCCWCCCCRCCWSFMRASAAMYACKVVHQMVSCRFERVQ